MKKFRAIIIFILIFSLWSYLFSLLDLTVERGLCGCPSGDFPAGMMVDCACSIFLGRPFYGNHDFWVLVMPWLIFFSKMLLSYLTHKLFLKIFRRQ